MPEADLHVSPFTGWTRQHWTTLADDLVSAAALHASPSGARITPPGRPSWSGSDSDGLEGFARTFLLAAIRTAGGGDPERLAPYARGLAAGVDPRHPEAWPRLAQECRQTLVESCSLVLGLQLTRSLLWDRLPERTRELTVQWLTGAFGLTIPDNNWHLFRVAVARFLRSVGAPGDEAEVARDLARVEDFYRGAGWYTDGPGQRYDHYCGWAMHTYPALLDHVFPEVTQFPYASARLRRFLTDAVELVGADGAPMHQGRSLSYRFAAAAAPWVGALVGASPLPPGRTRRLCSGMAKHFVEHGFTDAHGVPTLGWYAAYPPMIQAYSAPASPFWLAKGFLGLLLPESHSCWTDTEQALPVELRDRSRVIEPAGFLVNGTHADGVVRLANHGSDNHPPLDGVEDPYYSRLSYSTATAPLLEVTSAEPMLDNHLGVLDATGHVSRRGRIRDGTVAEHVATSWHEPVFTDGRTAGGRIETTVVADGPWELRCHRLLGCAATEMVEGGWQLASDTFLQVTCDASSARVGTERLDSLLVPLHGHDGTPRVREGTRTSAYAARAGTPYVRSSLPDGEHVVVTLVGLGHELDPGTATATVHRGVVDAVLPSGLRAEVSFGPGRVEWR